MASKKKSLNINKETVQETALEIVPEGGTIEDNSNVAQPGPEPEQQPEYSLNWMVQLSYKDKMGSHILGSYSNSVMTDTMKLIERACTMAGQQMFQKIVEDSSV